MKQVSFIFVVFVSMFTFALTEEAQVGAQVGTSEEVTIVKPNNQVVVEDTSEFHRLNKKYSVVAQLFGMGPSLLAGSGIQASYMLDRNSAVFVEYLGQEINNSPNNIDYTTRITGNSLGVHYKKFNGNSFYYHMGIDYRTVNFSHSYVDQTLNYDYSFSGNVTSLGIAIGNQWQWESFTLGCDWIGLSRSIGSNKTSESIHQVGTSSAAHDLKNDEDAYFAQASVYLLRFYLGATF
jgi:hypothetical protein